MNSRASTSSYKPQSNVLKPRNSLATPIAKGLGRKTSIPRVSTGSDMKQQRGRSSVGQFSNRITPNKNTPKGSKTYLNVPQNIGRASIDSLRSVGGSKLKVKDTRPIQEPSFRSSCIDNVLSFLSREGTTFSRKNLQSPSNKDFLIMFNAIIKHLIPGKCIMKSPENEIPQLMKLLGYPTQLTKSAFLTVGTTHTWPSILAMLSWLVDNVRFNEDCGLSMDDALDGVSLDNIEDCLKFENDEEIDNVVQERMNIIRAQKGLDEAGKEHLQQEIEEVNQKIEFLKEDMLTFGETQKKLELLNMDSEKLLIYKNDLSNYVLSKEEDLNKIFTSFKEQEIQNIKLCERLQYLENVRDNQTLSLEEIKILRSKLKEGKSDIEILRAEIDTTKKNTWETEMKVGSAHEMMMSAIYENNQVCNNLKLDLTLLSSNEEELLEIIQERKQQFVLLENECKQEMEECNKKLNEMKEKISKLKKIHTQKTAELNTKTKKLNRLNDEYESTKKVLTDEETLLIGKKEEMEEKLRYSQVHLKPVMNTEERKEELMRIQREYENVSKKSQERIEEGADFILKYCIEVHKEVEANKLKYENLLQNLKQKQINMIKEREEILKDVREKILNKKDTKK